MEKEFMTFDEAVGALVVEPDDLKRMVSEGEIRAYRDAGDVKFRSEDVQALREGMDTEPTIDIGGDEPSGAELQNQPSSEFLDLSVADFEDEVVLDPPAEAETPAPVAPAAPIELEDTVMGLAPAGLDDTVASRPDEEETFVLADDDLDASKTVPLELFEDEPAVGDSTAQESDPLLGVSEVQTPDMLGIPRVASGQHPVMLALVLLSTAIMVFGVLLVIGLVSGYNSVATAWFVKLCS